MVKQVLLLLALTVACGAAEKQFDFASLSEGETPAGFSSLLVGQGEPGVWKIIMDEVPPALKPFSTRAVVSSKRPVLAQVSKDKTDERFPVFVYNDEIFDDFTFTVRFKIVDGVAEQMAGVVFRFQDTNNFYVARANAKDGNFRFYKVVNGLRGTIIGPSMEIKKGEWYELTVDCKGNKIHILLNGKEVMPALTDNSFSKGKIGFWTKSDSVAAFSEAKIVFTPRVPYSQSLISDTIRKYPRLLGLKIYAPNPQDKQIKIIGSTDKTDIGKPGEKAEQDVLSRGVVYTLKGKKTYEVWMPLHDRNGDIVACARVVLSTFPGQTEQNAIVRAMPIVKYLESKIKSASDLFE
ncbi:MAG: family 16 glycoside hydrolase [Verrucomicrobiia bacterium]